MSTTPKVGRPEATPNGATRDMVLKLTEQGLGLRAIAAACGISTQGVHYHLKKLREAGELPQDGAA